MINSKLEHKYLFLIDVDCACMVPIRGSAGPRSIPQRSANFKMSGNTFLGRPAKHLGSKVSNIWILIRKMKLPKASLHIFVGLLSGFCFQVSISNELSVAVFITCLEHVSPISHFLNSSP